MKDLWQDFEKNASILIILAQTKLNKRILIIYEISKENSSSSIP